MVRLFTLVLALPALARPSIDAATRSFRDEQGRHLLFHGVNVVYKKPPYIPTDGAFDCDKSLNDEDINDLQSWGVNLVRLGVMWEGVEREPGVYDDAYLSKMDKLMRKLGAKGIFTIVDAHQDVWANVMCGEGIPNFYAKAVLEKHGAHCFGGGIGDTLLAPLLRHFGYCKSMESYGMRKDAEGNFLNEDCLKATNQFSDFYSSPEALTVARALFNNDDGLQDRFIDFWKHISVKFAENPYVLGFDPLNEPFASWSSSAQAISRISPGRFDRSVLAPLYARVHEANQAASKDSILLFEPAIFPDDNPLGPQPLGFEVPPGGEISSTHHAVNSHTYCCEVSSQKEACAATGEPSNSSEAGAKCHAFHERNIGQRAKDAKRLGIPLLVSEFGACLDSEVCAREIQQVADTCDEHLASWAYWEFKTYEDITTTAGDGSEGFYTKDGGVQVAKVRALARTYVQATQGTLLSTRFDSSTGAFQAEFQVSTAINASTVVHALQQGKGATTWYPAGFDFSLTGPDGMALTENQVIFDAPPDNKVVFTVTDAALTGQSLSLMIKARSSTARPNLELVLV